MYGFAIAPTTAVYAFGNLVATGTKSFQIDHPLAPESKWLNHYCTEGAEPLNTYSGNVVLDDRGEAWVELPEWFELINRDHRYQLTAIGGAAPELRVAREIENNRFQIGGGKAGMKVSWRVEAVRNDLYVQTYGAPVEIEKPAESRGKYLYPDLYGHPPTMGLHESPIRHAAHEQDGSRCLVEGERGRR